MLVLSRHRDEIVCIGDEIQVAVVDIRGDKVRLGIEAPANVPVHRREVYDAIKRRGDTGEPVNLGLATTRAVTTWPGPKGEPLLEFISDEERPYRIRKHWLTREELIVLHAAIGAALEEGAAA